MCRWITWVFAVLMAVAAVQKAATAGDVQIAGSATVVAPLAVWTEYPAEESGNFNYGRPPYDTRVCVTCFVYLLGIAGGIAALFMKRFVPGLLFAAGFAMLAVEPLLDVIIFRLIYPALTGDIKAMDWAYAIGSSIGVFLGVSMIVAGFLLALRKPKH